jgi:hypothetical protein
MPEADTAASAKRRIPEYRVSRGDGAKSRQSECERCLDNSGFEITGQLKSLDAADVLHGAVVREDVGGDAVDIHVAGVRYQPA